jgi:hypothetical protein
MSLSPQRIVVKRIFSIAFGPIKTSVRGYEIPEHLKSVATDPDPSFYRMVEYYYHNAVRVVEPALLEYLKKHTHMSDKKRLHRVAGILKVSVDRLTYFGNIR